MEKSTLVIKPETGTIDRRMPTGEIRANVGSACQGYRIVWCDGKMLRVHRIIWEHVNGSIPDGKEIDHINGLRSDNRISNLRLVTKSENLQNRHLPREGSRSGVKGVVWDEQSQRWKAKLMANGKRHFLGSFTTVKEARSAYVEGAARFHTHNPIAKAI